MKILTILYYCLFVLAFCSLHAMKRKDYRSVKKNDHFQRKETNLSDVSHDALCISSEFCFKCDKQHKTIFHAISDDCMVCVMFFVKKGCGDAWRKKKPHHPLEKACSEGHFEIARYLIENNNHFKIMSKRAYKLVCSSLKHAQIIQLLVEKGIIFKDEKELSVLLYEALQLGYSETAVILLDNSANINLVFEEKIKQKHVPLIVLAAQQGFEDVLILILKKLQKSKKFNFIDECDYCGGTALCYAFEKGYENIVCILLKAGAQFCNNTKKITISKNSKALDLLDKAFSKMNL